MNGNLARSCARVGNFCRPLRWHCAPTINEEDNAHKKTVLVLVTTTVASSDYVRADRLRALAVTAATCSDELPEIPTVGEFVSDYEASAWYGVGVPKGTPAVIIEKLNKEINAGLADPKIKARLVDLGGTPLVGSPADFGKFIADETEKWGKVVKFVGIKAD